MAINEQFNFRPRFEQETVPCEGDAGDFLILTPLRDHEPDPEPQGQASVWFCIKGQIEGEPSVWARVQFDGVATCRAPVPTPPQARPDLTRG